MAYTKPTVDQFLLRYPIFDGVSEGTIQYWLTDAERVVDESWPEGDYAPALMMLAAHNMADKGALGSSNLPAGVTSIKSAGVNITLSDEAVSAKAKGGYGSTPYGIEFQALLRVTKGGPRVLGTLAPAWGCGC